MVGAEIPILEITHLCKYIQCKVVGSVLLSLAQLVELQFYQKRSIIGLESESESVLLSMLDIFDAEIFSLSSGFIAGLARTS